MNNKHKWITKKSDLWTIPNLMGYFRILLIPVFVFFYLRSDTVRDSYIAAAIIGLSGFTDLFDGMIARRFNMVTELGKLLDPVADKATFGAMLICLTIRHHWMAAILILFALKEGFMGIMGLIMLKRNGRKLDGAMWYGKVCTASLYIIIFVIMLLPMLSETAVNILIGIGAAIMLFTWMMYIPVFYKMWHMPPAK